MIALRQVMALAKAHSYEMLRIVMSDCVAFEVR